jgi:hypothetical protein
MPKTSNKVRAAVAAARTAAAVVEYVYCPRMNRMVPRSQSSQPTGEAEYFIHLN